jgi:hypothetical protein
MHGRAALKVPALLIAMSNPMNTISSWRSKRHPRECGALTVTGLVCLGGRGQIASRCMKGRKSWERSFAALRYSYLCQRSQRDQVNPVVTDGLDFAITNKKRRAANDLVARDQHLLRGVLRAMPRR